MPLLEADSQFVGDQFLQQWNDALWSSQQTSRFSQRLGNFGGLSGAVAVRLASIAGTGHRPVRPCSDFSRLRRLKQWRPRPYE